MEKIISKIKKLLEMTEANGASENEAMTAALKAQKLMAEYHISEKEISTEKSDKIVKKCTFIGTGNKWKYALAEVVGKNFRCEHFFDTKHSNLYFYGYNVDVEIAIKTFEMLFEIGKKTSVRCYNRIRNNCIKSGKSFNGKGIKNCFLVGFLQGISEALEKQSVALMIITPKEVKEGYMKIIKNAKPINGKFTARSYYAEESRLEGVKAGKNAINNRRLATV